MLANAILLQKPKFGMPKYLVTGGSGFIGTHLIREIKARGCEVLSIDIARPQDPSHANLWVACDIKCRRALLQAVEEFQPSHVIHLAAKANLNGRTVEDFPDNTLGTANVVECVNILDSVHHFVHTSTQYVVRPGVYPKSDDFLMPYTAYGGSKAVAEVTVRQNCKKNWTVVRPTNIWGPLHPFFPRELWRYLAKRYYLHPGFEPIMKYYGYVGNAVSQLLAVAEKAGTVTHKVFYVTDGPIDSYEWMNAFSLALSKKNARRLPRSLWQAIGMAGTVLKTVGLRSPVDSDRYFRLTVNESVPYQKIFEVAGSPPFSLLEGVKQSVEWYEANYAG